VLKRIVKMTFQPDAVTTFRQTVFEASKDRIRAFPGCQHMELLAHADTPNILFTLSIWDSAEALEVYRQSALFQETWAKTKVLFADRPEAWSVVVVDKGAAI
jgi:quinol monooxygenase YgiN